MKLSTIIGYLLTAIPLILAALLIIKHVTHNRHKDAPPIGCVVFFLLLISGLIALFFGI